MTGVASITPSNLEMSAMRVSVKRSADIAFVDLGATLDGVVISIAYKQSFLKADQLGSTDIDARVSGIDIKITTSLAEILNKDNVWDIMFPDADLTSGTGSYNGSKAVDFKSRVGAKLSDSFHQLLLHPLAVDDTDKSTDYLCYKVASTEETELTYTAEGQLKGKIVFKVYPDFSTSPARFMRFGDKDLV